MTQSKKKCKPKKDFNFNQFVCNNNNNTTPAEAPEFGICFYMSQWGSCSFRQTTCHHGGSSVL